MRVITNSEITVRKRCREEHRIAYVLGVRPVRGSVAMSFGSAAHVFLEHWWLASETYFSDALAAMMDSKHYRELDEYAQAMLRAVCICYDARWDQTRKDYNVLAVEAQFRMPKAGGYARGGKVDGMVRKGGLLLVLEHKTTSADASPGSPYWERLALDDQIGSYIEGAESLGYGTPDGVLYDVLPRPALKPKLATPVDSRKYKKDGTLYANQRDTDESPNGYYWRMVDTIRLHPEWFQRGVIVRLDSERERTRRDQHTIAREILRVLPDEPEPRTPGACMRYGTMCPYFHVCCGTADLNDPSRFRRVDAIHEELQ